VTGASRFLIGWSPVSPTYDNIPAVARASWGRVGAGRHTDQVGVAILDKLEVDNRVQIALLVQDAGSR
jgi:hypothetical protein